VEVLCEQAHSVNAGLRLNAIWALHHLVDSASADMKKLCLDQLESGWLVQLICDDTEDEALFSRNKSDRRLSAQGMEEDMEEDMDVDGFDEGSRPWLWAGMWRSNTSRSTSDRSHSARMQAAEKKLSALREAEINPVRKARNDDLAIQEQALNFIRNLITIEATPPGTDPPMQGTTEMIDYIFSEIGQDRLFDILSTKLRVKVLHAFSSSRRRSSTGRVESRVLYPQAKIIEAVAYILVHISASVPRHRQLVISQTDLLKTLGQQFNSRDKEVRVAVCQLMTNLVWQDDSSDAQACAQRALELKRLGFLQKLETLEREDGELDVRERAKGAVWQIKQTNL
jgi:armadillo repeat-containing protein 8